MQSITMSTSCARPISGTDRVIQGSCLSGSAREGQCDIRCAMAYFRARKATSFRAVGALAFFALGVFAGLTVRMVVVLTVFVVTIVLGLAILNGVRGRRCAEMCKRMRRW